MMFRCSGAWVTMPDDLPSREVRRMYRVYRQMIGLSPQSARRRLVFVTQPQHQEARWP